MPLPAPTKGEQESDFVSRCMSNDTMKSEFPDQKQRVAVCYSQWRKKHGQDETSKPYDSKQGATQGMKDFVHAVETTPVVDLTLNYLASLHSPFDYLGEHFVKVRLIDTSTSLPSWPDKIKWRVTYEGLKRALKSILGMPLIGPPKNEELKAGEGHLETHTVGVPVKFEMPNGYVDVINKVTDENAWRKIKNREWTHVSPEVFSRQYELGSSGEHVLDDFVFKRCVFVDEGAFPRATIQQFWDAEMLHQLSAELSQSPDSGVTGEELTNGAASTLVGPQAADEKKKIQGGISLTNENSNSQISDDEVEVHGDYLEAEQLSYKQRQKMPRSSFAYVDADGKGHLPINDASHVQAALSAVKNWAFRGNPLGIPKSAKAAILRKVCAAAKNFGVKSELCGDKMGEEGGTCNMSDTDKNDKPTELDTVKADNAKLQGELAKAHLDIELAKRGQPKATYEAEIARLKESNDELKTWKAQKETEDLSHRVNTIVDMEIETGITDIRDRAAKVEQYKTLNCAALDALKGVLEPLEIEVRAGGPKAKYSAAKATNTLEGAVRARFAPWTLKKEGV